jgi:hypothetical protein
MVLLKLISTDEVESHHISGEHVLSSGSNSVYQPRANWCFVFTLWSGWF